MCCQGCLDAQGRSADWNCGDEAQRGGKRYTPWSQSAGAVRWGVALSQCRPQRLTSSGTSLARAQAPREDACLSYSVPGEEESEDGLSPSVGCLRRHGRLLAPACLVLRL